VKGSGVEVGTVGPNQSVDFGIDAHLIEEPKIAQGAKEFAGENGTEVDQLFGVVIEANTQRVWRFDLEGANSVNGMYHDVSSLHQRLDWQRHLAGLKKIPIREKFGLMQFGPSFNQPSLPAGQ
jgi:hypothetical protein